MKSTGNMLKKFLLLAFIVLITLLIIVAVCMFVSNTLQIPALIAILILGLFFLVIGLNSFTRYRLTFARFFLVSLFSFIFVFLASAYLDIRTIDDVKNNISGAFSIKQGQFRENIDLIVKRTDLKTVQMNDIDNQVTSTQTNPTSPNTSQTISSIIKEKSNEKSLSGMEWKKIKRRYPLMFWPQLLMEDIVKVLDKRQKMKIKHAVERLNHKSKLYKQITHYLT